MIKYCVEIIRFVNSSCWAISLFFMILAIWLPHWLQIHPVCWDFCSHLRTPIGNHQNIKLIQVTTLYYSHIRMGLLLYKETFNKNLTFKRVLDSNTLVYSRLKNVLNKIMNNLYLLFGSTSIIWGLVEESKVNNWNKNIK